jgi:hypothetical protein
MTSCATRATRLEQVSNANAGKKKGGGSFVLSSFFPTPPPPPYTLFLLLRGFRREALPCKGRQGFPFSQKPDRKTPRSIAAEGKTRISFRKNT